MARASRPPRAPRPRRLLGRLPDRRWLLAAACARGARRSTRCSPPARRRLLPGRADRVRRGPASSCPTQVLARAHAAAAADAARAAADRLRLRALRPRRRRFAAGCDVGRLVIAPADAGSSSLPPLVLVLARRPDARMGRRACLRAALVALLACDAALTVLRAGSRSGCAGRRATSCADRPVDVLLAPVGLLAAFGAAASRTPSCSCSRSWPSSRIFAREREARIDGALELSQAYRGTALLLGDVIEADDQYTGDHTKDVVELTAAGRRRAGRGRRDLAAAPSSAPCCTTSARSTSRRRSSTSRGRSTTTSG